MHEGSLADELHSIGSAHGLDEVGFCSAHVFAETRRALHERKAAGLHADMQFTYRNPDRSTDPGRALPGARSIVVGARSYRRLSAEDEATAAGNARVAEYVWEPPYTSLRAALDAVAAHLTEHGWRTRVLIDDNALVDRAAAHRAGIGWWGKNSNLLLPGRGSRFVLGSVVTDAPIAGTAEPLADQCGPCTKCVVACPTGAIVADGVIDSGRCLAWLVQAAGPFPREYRVALGDRIYGCDDCQSTCPPNVIHDRNDEPQLTTGRSAVPVEEILTLGDDELLDRFGSWYIPRREPRYLRRNALVVLANVADPDSPVTRSLVERHLRSPDEIERAHAVWAAHRLGYDDQLDAMPADASDLVNDELAAVGRTVR